MEFIFFLYSQIKKCMGVLCTSFLLLTINACGPFEAKNSNRDRQDDTVGEDEYIFDDIDDLLSDDPSQRDSTADDSSCKEYKAGSINLIPWDDYPPNILQRCLAKALDDNLKPLCDEQKQMEDALKYYEDRGDEDKAEDIRDNLEALKEVKYTFMDDLYDIADEFDDISGNLQEDLGHRVDKEVKDHPRDATWWKIIQSVGNVGIKDSVGGFTRVLDKRARKACRSQIDLEEFKRWRNRR